MTQARSAPEEDVFYEIGLMDSIPHPIFVVAGDGTIQFVNVAAENFLSASFRSLNKASISEILPDGNPVRSLIEQAQRTRTSISEYDVEFSTPRTEAHNLDVQVVPTLEDPDTVLVIMQVLTMARKLNRQLTNRGSARSVSGMAEMLAHEIKNPLSGIKGAAQLLEQNATDNDRPLTQLICTETDRIASLVDRMEIFSDPSLPSSGDVNIHSVLDHVRRLAQTGFAQAVRIVELYDPSLPSVRGNRDQLIQVFLNLVKNAAESVRDRDGGTITLRTAYRPGVRIAVSGSTERVSLPFEVSIEDNGGGIREDIRPHLFDPFVTSKVNGSGLGLALVAKIVGDHGGTIECDSNSERTIFRTLLPVFDGDRDRKDTQ